MLAGTHIAFSSVLYLGGATVFEYETSIINWAIAALFSLMPDIDLPTSKVGRPLFFISVPLEKRFGHRTITHSLIGVGILSALASPLYFTYPLAFWAIVGGYWSHLQIDMANIRGVDLFWPSAIRVVMPGKIKFRLEVGSKAEMIVMCSLLVFCLGLYPMSNLGLRGGLHQILRNFEIAHDEYVKVQGKNFYSLELNAIDNLTLEHIACNCPILGAWQGGLIVEYNGQSRAVGDSEVNHNLFPKEAVLIKGEPLRVITQRVNMNGRSLRWLVNNLKANHDYYLLGELFVDSGMMVNVNDIELYHPVMFSGSSVRLHYAKASDLSEYLNMVAIRGEVVVQFWLRPGDEGVELRFSGGESGSTPGGLERMF
ncbi:MAG: metal-dependent hydrolase [Methylococcaceae bacterium]|nr:metal-dependent hydrolase [Methylococcaceae bacterium]